MSASEKFRQFWTGTSVSAINLRNKVIIFASLAIFLCFCLGAFFAWPFCTRPPIQTPPSARWIMSCYDAVGPGSDIQVRFSAPYDDCVKAADAILQHNQKKKRGETNTLKCDRIEIKNGNYLTEINRAHSIKGFARGDGGYGHEWWFRPDRIQNGMFITGPGSFPDIWIDKDRCLFYYRLSD